MQQLPKQSMLSSSYNLLENIVGNRATCVSETQNKNIKDKLCKCVVLLRLYKNQKTEDIQ